MKIITAEEARIIAGPSMEDKAESLGKTIIELAKKGHRRCRTGYDHPQDDDLWAYGGYNKSSDWKRAKEILEHYGYKVTFYYDDSKQFVDMYTLIEW